MARREKQTKGFKIMENKYNKKYEAHVSSGGCCLVPDQVAEDQKAYDGALIEVLVEGKPVQARLNGEAYGLWTTGTGDMVVDLV